MLLCVDLGGSYTKIVQKQGKNYVFKKFKSSIPYKYINDIMLTHKCSLIFTGARTDFIEPKKLCCKYIIIDEIQAVANIARFLRIEKAVVVNIGTGTPFIVFDNGKHNHYTGTGIGGGTFSGLSKLLLGISDMRKVYSLAKAGYASKVNTTINDISKTEISWLKKDVTVSNFGKIEINSAEANSLISREDIAMGIHSIVGEPIGSIAAGVAKGIGLDFVIFAGGVCENNIIRKTISNCLEIFGLKAIFIDNPSYGTCFGAMTIFENKDY
jgi:type II pantothenate kinase